MNKQPSIQELRVWLESLFQEKGIDPNEILECENEVLGFGLRLNDGTAALTCLSAEEDGYFNISCLECISVMNAVFDELLWAKTCYRNDLRGTTVGGETAVHYGWASLTIRPQSVDELRADLERFVTRISLAVEAFREATNAKTDQ